MPSETTVPSEDTPLRVNSASASNSAIAVVATTCDQKEALQRIAQSLIQARLAACVQISGPIESCYRWEDQIETGVEWSASVKTLPEKLPRVLDAIKAAHPYQVPEIIIQTLTASPEYGLWLRQQIS